MALTKEKKADIVKRFAKDEKDTGSAEVQIAILTEEIKALTEHLKEHKHDFHSIYLSKYQSIVENHMHFENKIVILFYVLYFLYRNIILH